MYIMLNKVSEQVIGLPVSLLCCSLPRHSFSFVIKAITTLVATILNLPSL